MKERLLGIFGLGPKKSPELVPEKPAPKETLDLRIEIGNSLYLLSNEAQRHLERVGASDYKKSRSILMINEPHESIEGQFNLYKGLEIFFRDNPSLIGKTVFLAEGFPANQPISVKPLIEVEANPDEELIWEVLGTFLITGYMAYEWKYQHGIPIIGTEDPILYQLGSRLYPAMSKETALLFNLCLYSRNKSIAQTLVQKSKMFENPILFVGERHVDSVFSFSFEKGIVGATVFQVLEVLEEEGLAQIGPLLNLLSPDELKALRGGEVSFISDHLKKEKIGYTFFDSRGLISARDEETYKSLFRAQQDGSYDEYLARQISERISTTTTRPSPEAAAQFLKDYLKARPDNPKARAAASRGRSLAAEGKYFEAAEEFSAASAADLKIPGYVLSFQESLKKGIKSRIIRVCKKLKTKKYTINPSVEPDLPVYGPYQEEDHYERVSEFAKIFAKIPGKQEAIDNAMHRHCRIRYGGILQVKGGQQLRPENVRAFEERHHLRSKGLKGGARVNRVDIATKDDIAIECKNFVGDAKERSIEDWVKQAAPRFEPDIKGYRYKGVIIVVPDESNLQEIEPVLNHYIKSNYSKLLGKIRVCRLSQLKETYSLTRGK